MITMSVLSMAFHVQCQVIASRKASRAYRAGERLVTGVLSSMTCQFITARETPTTARPMAGVRFLATTRRRFLWVINGTRTPVDALVRFEV